MVRVPCTPFEEQLLRQLEETETRLEVMVSATSDALTLAGEALTKLKDLIPSAYRDPRNIVWEEARLLEMHVRARAIVSRIAWAPPYDKVVAG